MHPSQEIAKINTLYVSLICLKHWRLSLRSKITATQSLKHFKTFASTLQDINQKIQKQWLYSCMLLLSLCQVNGVEFYISTVSEDCKCNYECISGHFFSFFPGGEKWLPEIGLLLQAKLSAPDADFWPVHTPELSFQTLSHQILEQPEQKKNRFIKTTTKLTNGDYRYTCIEWS